MPRPKEPTELHLGLADYDLTRLQLRLRSQEHARGIFLLTAAQLEPRLLETLGTICLEPYRRLFPPFERPTLTEQQEQQLASNIGSKPHELISLDEVVRAELGDKYQPSDAIEAQTLIYPFVYWRDPTPDPQQGELYKQDRLARGLNVHAEAERLGLLVSELTELELGCGVRAGLTSSPGAKPLRDVLQRWRRRWQLPEWTLNWALERLGTWDSINPPDYALDPFGVVLPPPHLPTWHPGVQTWGMYFDDLIQDDDIKGPLIRYRDEILALHERELAMRNIGQKRAREGDADRHFYWLAGYQLCGWSKNAISEAVNAKHPNRAAVQRALYRTAQLIGLKLRPAEKNDPTWTAERICAKLSTD